MPGNESLIYDAKTASRWQPLSERMDGGQMPDDMFGDIQDSFYLLCGKVWRRWKRFGVDPSQLFDAALNDPKNALPDLIKRVSYDGSAQLLRDVAAELPEADMEELYEALVSLYSGGLDSSSGLAIRAAAQPGRMIVPVTVRHQMQKAKLIRDHFSLLMDCGILKQDDFNPFQAGAFIRNTRIKQDHQAGFREITHRCRPLLFMSVAGLVANSCSAPEVEVFESGVGSINLPLVGGAADYGTTRSTHPAFLRLLSALVSHVKGASVKYVLPFADKTKAEMVGMLKAMGLEELARNSVSCILHPLKRRGWQQCGRCAACVFRRQAMLTAGIAEEKDADARRRNFPWITPAKSLAAVEGATS